MIASTVDIRKIDNAGELWYNLPVCIDKTIPAALETQCGLFQKEVLRGAI